MANTYFQFKQFRIDQKRSGMKVTTDACLFGAWIAQQIIESNDEPTHILDIGTGTGLLTLMLGQVTKEAGLDAVEMNLDAFEESAQNFKDSEWSDRIRCFHTSIQEFQPLHSYDLIICNPPFFGKNQKGDGSKKNQAVHNDSLSMEDLSDSITHLIGDTGVAYVLYPEWEMKAFIKWMKKRGLSVNESLSVRNKAGSPVFRQMCRFSKNDSSFWETELFIRDRDGHYSDEFNQLLKYYYLNTDN